MAKFAYEGRDVTNQPCSGMIEALDGNDAVQQLGARGIRVASLGPAPSAPIGAPPIRLASPSAPSKQANLALSDGSLHLALTQLGNLLQSGMSPVQAFERLAQRQPNPNLAAAYRDAAARVAEGMSVADALRRYPNAFPRDVTGAIQAGETAGYTWQACVAAAEQIVRLQKIRRVFWWAGTIVLSSIPAVPFALAMVKGLEQVFKTGHGLDALFGGAGKAFLGPIGWSLALMLVVYFAMRRWLRSPKSRAFRHRLAFELPMARKRTRSESLSVFTWHLSNLSNAGLPPFQAWRLAANAVPNDAASKALLEAGAGAREDAPLATIAYRANLVPQEYAGLFETGELTGNLPQAFSQAADLSRADLEAADQGLKFRAGCWAFLLMSIVSAIAMGLFLSGYFNAAFRFILEDSP